MAKVILSKKEKEERETGINHCMSLMSLDNDADLLPEDKALIDEYINGDIDEDELCSKALENAKKRASK